jgi:hypothetical protein
MRRITQRVIYDMVGKELFFGKADLSLGNVLRLVGSSPSKVLVVDITKVKIGDVAHLLYER